ncbi:hypothetical protein B0H14DRAFT_2653047 [Mycena olivaceomarginata]|nr:hypothetical protein B0H14DRAFT_2653047 [Mycena olivaceomarginata]
MPKRKAQPSGLNRAGGNFMPGPKKLRPNKKKANKENVTVYVATVSSDSEDDDTEATFSSLPVRGIHSTPSIHAGPKKKPTEPSLRPYTDMDNMLPDLEPLSDDEYENDAIIQADDEGDNGLDDDPDDPEKLAEMAGLWDNGVYADVFSSFCTTKSATIPTAQPAARPTSAADEDEEMPFDPEKSTPDFEAEELTTFPVPPPHNRPATLEAFANPWMSDSNDPAPAPSANAWRFNFSADSEDDEYLEGFGSDDQESVPDDACYESVDEEPEEGHPEDDAREYTFTVPSIDEAKAALKAINLLLRPPRNTGAGYKKCELTLYTRTRLEWVASFLQIFDMWSGGT